MSENEAIKTETPQLNMFERVAKKIHALTPEHLDVKLSADGLSVEAINKRTGKQAFLINLEQCADASDATWDDSVVDAVERSLPFIISAWGMIKGFFRTKKK